MNSTQRRRILEVRDHFEHKYDVAFEESVTMSMVGGAEIAEKQVNTALRIAYYQGVLKAVDLILQELD